MYRSAELHTITHGYNFEVDWEITLPLPSQDQWRNATLNDPDLAKVVNGLVHNLPIAAADFICKAYAEELQQRRLEHENGAVYRYEHNKVNQARKLCTTVVPTT